MSISKTELQEFKSEAMELLQIAEKSLLEIDQPGHFKQHFNAVFRCFHNLKCSAGMMELLELEVHIHTLETELMNFKDILSIPKGSLSYFLKGIEDARSLLQAQGSPRAATDPVKKKGLITQRQPIGSILKKFTRVVRDLSQELGKKISLTLSGVDIELEKCFLDAIKDPLTHLVRNSCDHGIETPTTRLRAGKSEYGSLSIKACQDGNQVVIEIADDGKGLDPVALLKKGIEKGFIQKNQQLSEKEILSLIFYPGFSLAETVTNVSGRGVGMDVVRTNIEQVGGTVDLASVTQRGTTVRIKLPSS
jgi:two-component system chemotaxis sensor kinase CheA